MYKTIEATIDKKGHVKLLEPVHVLKLTRAVLTILDSDEKEGAETALLSESSLAVDWNRPEEDEAWRYLQ